MTPKQNDCILTIVKLTGFAAVCISVGNIQEFYRTLEQIEFTCRYHREHAIMPRIIQDPLDDDEL